MGGNPTNDAFQDTTENLQAAVADREQKERCAKASELTIGLTTQEVLTVCGRGPLNAVDSVTVEGKREAWVYRDTSLLFMNGKLARIQRER